MAYTSAPETQTYGSQKIPAVTRINVRNNLSAASFNAFNVDGGMLNLIPMLTKDKDMPVVAEERWPIRGEVVFTGNSESIKGVYAWDKGSATRYYYVATSLGIYSTSNFISWTKVVTYPGTRTEDAGFSEFIDATNTKKLIIVNGYEGYVFTTDAAYVQITDVDFPTPHLPFPIFLDGYLFLAKTGTGDIYNSNLNDPTAWTAGSYISSELYPDDLIALTKINNYILAIGSRGCEYFYDAANATASPLARYDGGVLPFGTTTPKSIASNLNKVVMIAQNNDGQYTLKLIEDFKYKEIPDSAWLITNLINYAANTGSSIITYFHGYFMRHGDQLMYVLTYGTGGRVAFAYCFDTEVWVTLADFNTTNSWSAKYASIPTTNAYSVVAGTVTLGGVTTTYFGYYAPMYGYQSSAVDQYNGPSGSSFPINCQIRTQNLSFGTLNKKTMNRFGVYATFSSYSESPTTITVRWTDDDFQTTSSGTPMYFSGTGTADFPFITQLGMFRNRSMILDYSGSAYVRFYYLEFDLNKQQQ